MRNELDRSTLWRRAALSGALGASLILSGCGGADAVVLPADRTESAGLCYGATLALAQEKVGKGSVPLDAASHALQFALLAATDGDLDDPADPLDLGDLMRLMEATMKVDDNPPT